MQGDAETNQAHFRQSAIRVRISNRTPYLLRTVVRAVERKHSRKHACIKRIYQNNVHTIKWEYS